MGISVQVTTSIDKINVEEWDDVSAGIPFQSHSWHQFGEKVMADSTPLYLLAYLRDRLVGRATLWITRNEPLPQSLGHMRRVLSPIFRKWPLMICRSPIAQTTGMVLVENLDDPKGVVEALVATALAQGRHHGCAALVMDYLGRREKEYLPPAISIMESPYPGNILCNEWKDFDQYLARGDKKARRHYHRTLREIEELQVTIAHRSKAEKIDEILPLVRNVEKQHGAPQNPWIENTLINMEMGNGLLLAATMNDRLVGCMLFLEDGNGQLATAFGREPEMPYVYLGLFYEGIRTAMEHNIKFLRWGSGAYELKRRMGFRLEDNGLTGFALVQPFLWKSVQMIMKLTWR